MMKSATAKSGRVTLGDIARHAGISVSTASLVLAGKAQERRISADVVTRVRHAAAALDYAPNLLVHSMQSGRTHILSFFNGFRSRGRDDLYMDRLSTALERAAGDLGYDILVSCDFRRPTEETYRYLNGGRSDGLIFFAPRPDDPLLPYMRTSRLPIVLINSTDEAGALSHIKDDMEDGMCQVADQLLALGHRRIAALTNIPDGNAEAGQRVAALQRCLTAHGLPIPEHWVVSTDDTQKTDAGAALRFLLREPQPPTALFCWHDRIGYQVLEQCDLLGVSVPRDLSVIGYDGLRWPATTRHTLASVSVDLDQLAAAAIVLLDDLIHGKEKMPLCRTLPVTLSEGSTLAAPGQKGPNNESIYDVP